MKSNLFYAARVITLLALLAGALSLTGCAGLSVSWKVVATYNTPHEAPGPSVAIETPAETKK